MKFTCTKENLVYALAVVGNVANKQSNLPILANILFHVEESKVELVATNLEIATKAQLRAKIDAPGSFTVPAKTLIDFIGLVREEQVEIVLEGQELIIKAGSSSTKIKGVSAEDYPVVPDIEEEHAYVFDVQGFRQALADTVFAVAKNEIRPELSGVYFGFMAYSRKGLTLAATDSYRLAERQIQALQGTDEVTCIVPAKTVSEFIRLLGLQNDQEHQEKQVRLWVGQNQIAIRYDSFEMTSRVIEGTYPDYTQIIPNSFKTVANLPVDITINAIKAASLFSTTGVNSITFSALAGPTNTFNIASASTQTGEHTSTIDAVIEGDNNSIVLNYRYVLEGVQHMHTDNIQFKINSSDTPCVLAPTGNEGFLYIVMPIRQ